MINSLAMFLATESHAAQALPRLQPATPSSPPASSMPARAPAPQAGSGLRLAVAVLGNAAGFAVLMGWCWLSLRLVQALLAS